MRCLFFKIGLDWWNLKDLHYCFATWQFSTQFSTQISKQNSVSSLSLLILTEVRRQNQNATNRPIHRGRSNGGNVRHIQVCNVSWGAKSEISHHNYNHPWISFFSKLSLLSGSIYFMGKCVREPDNRFDSNSVKAVMPSVDRIWQDDLDTRD